MLSLAVEGGEPSRANAESAGRKRTILHGAIIAIVALMALAAYLTLDQALRVERDSAPVNDTTNARRALSNRIAGLTAPGTLGNSAIGGELRTAISDFDRADAAAAAQREERAERKLSILQSLGFVICAITLATLLVASLAVWRPMARCIARLTQEAAELDRFATTDPLTGMLNRRSFQARGAIEIQKARRYARPLSLLMIDADQLRAIEVAHGPSGGQTIVKALTSSFFAGTRISDLLARVDADQFAILLPETDSAGAQLLAERLRSKIGDLSVTIDDTSVSCTVSIGVAAAEKDAAFLWPTFKRADEALYEAKMRGRNRVVVAAAA